ncbi:MAG TPA: XTP/dITP diphosphatase [Halanaerobiales bacterium]|nr:XTP/dITP diphosphatase [Halanaerobiales bacterium]
MERKLLIASNNQGKIREIRCILKDFDLQITAQNIFPELKEVKEDGESFQENALKKARTRARETGLLTLADDSGLEVDYLNGRPGIYSARYAGADADDRDNYRKLLKEMQGVLFKQRKARFRAVIALVDPKKDQEITVEGSCEGIIVDRPSGDSGFGYDPVFYLPEYKKTMAEIPAEQKNRISHRAKALQKLREEIKRRYPEL